MPNAVVALISYFEETRCAAWKGYCGRILAVDDFEPTYLEEAQEVQYVKFCVFYDSCFTGRDYIE
jgi:hypothetical protein